MITEIVQIYIFICYMKLSLILLFFLALSYKILYRFMFSSFWKLFKWNITFWNTFFDNFASLQLDFSRSRDHVQAACCVAKHMGQSPAPPMGNYLGNNLNRVKGERQIHFWSCLNYLSDICQFKRSFCRSRTLQFVWVIVKYLLKGETRNRFCNIANC